MPRRPGRPCRGPTWRSGQASAGSEVPSAAAQGRVEGQDLDSCLLEVLEVGALVGVPALVHHDLHAVKPRLRGPGVDPLEPERIEGTGTEEYG